MHFKMSAKCQHFVFSQYVRFVILIISKNISLQIYVILICLNISLQIKDLESRLEIKEGAYNIQSEQLQQVTFNSLAPG